MECTDASDIRMALHRLSAGVWINISRILFVFLVKGECMTRQEFINHYPSSIAGKRDAKRLMKDADIFLNGGPNRYGYESENLNPQQEEYLKMAWEGYDNDDMIQLAESVRLLIQAPVPKQNPLDDVITSIEKIALDPLITLYKGKWVYKNIPLESDEEINTERE